MKTTYFVAENYDLGFEGIYKYDGILNKDDYVVVDYGEEPIVAKVIRKLSRHQALTSRIEPEDIIDIVNIKAWNMKREKELNANILMNKMEERVKLVRTIETMEKFAGKDPVMASLLAEFNNENSEEEHEDLE